MAVMRIRAYVSSPVALTEPLHLDGLCVAVARGASKGGIARGSSADDIVRPPLPLAQITSAGHEIYICTAAEVAPDARRAREYLTRRRDGADLDYLTGRVDTRSGPGRDVMMQYAVWLTPYLEWWCVGGRQGVRTMIERRVTHVGAIRRHGMGEVQRWVFERTDEDAASVLVRAGRARRNLPGSWCESPELVERVPVSAPYWHPSVVTDGVMAGRLTDLAPDVRAKLESLC